MRKVFACSLATAAVLGSLWFAPAQADEQTDDAVRFATFNASLNRDEDGQLLRDLADGSNEQARNAAETIQRMAPDVVLVNEFDYDADGKAVDLFRTNYLEVSQNGADPIEYPYAWCGPVNTGVPSGFDLNNDGTVGGPDDAWGFGKFPGQYGFVVYSKHPIKAEDVRTFQNFLWKDMPDNQIPENWFDDDELEQVRLSSKTHADIPVEINGEVVHVLAAHPTPPSFDGEEKRNKRRNFDEIRLWHDYVAGDASYLYDDAGKTGGFQGDHFVIMGDYNSDPNDGDSWPGAIHQLLELEQLTDPKPASQGGVEAAKQGGANDSHVSDPQYDTSDFNDNPAPGNLRVDYVLPSSTLTVADSEVFWPTADDELSRLTGEYPFPTSDHRLVWVNVELPGGEEPEPSPSPSTLSPTPEPSESESPAPEPSSAAPAPQPSTSESEQPSAAPSQGKKKPGLPKTGA